MMEFSLKLNKNYEVILCLVVERGENTPTKKVLNKKLLGNFDPPVTDWLSKSDTFINFLFHTDSFSLE